MIRFIASLCALVIALFGLACSIYSYHQSERAIAENRQLAARNEKMRVTLIQSARVVIDLGNQLQTCEGTARRSL